MWLAAVCVACCQTACCSIARCHPPELNQHLGAEDNVHRSLFGKCDSQGLVIIVLIIVINPANVSTGRLFALAADFHLLHREMAVDYLQGVINW